MQMKTRHALHTLSRSFPGFQLVRLKFAAMNLKRLAGQTSFLLSLYSKPSSRFCENWASRQAEAAGVTRRPNVFLFVSNAAGNRAAGIQPLLRFLTGDPVNRQAVLFLEDHDGVACGIIIGSGDIAVIILELIERVLQRFDL